MQNITRNSQETIYLSIYDNGVLVPADSTPSVSIYDADTSVIIAGYSDLAPVYDAEAGTYSLYLNQNITGLNRVIEVIWSYTLNGVNGTHTDYYKIETTYADPNEIIDFFSFGSDPSKPNYHDTEELVSAEKIARTIIDGYTYQTFGRYYGSQEQFGKGGDAIELVEKMITLQKVWENDILLIDNTVDPIYNNFGFGLELSPTGKAVRIINAGWDVRYDNQVDPSVLYYGRFRDAARYKFEGDIGYKYVPEDIKLAAMLLVNDIISNDFNWRNKYLKKVDLSEIAFEMANGAFNGTGNIVVDNILDQYRNINIVII